VTSWTHYNEWGEITHNAVLKSGKRELDLVKRYATHDYDAVLGLYYAKARFYDAENRRFAAVDPIKAGQNWYMYCGNNPVIWIDATGLYYIFKGEDGQYFAVPENAAISGCATVTDELVPVFGKYFAEKIRTLQNKDAISGNSLVNDKGNQATVGKAISDISKEYITNAFEESIEMIFGEIAKDVTGFVGTAYSAVELLKAVNESGKIPQMDSVIFELFKLTGIVPKSKSLGELEVLMEAATAYVQANSWLFLNASYTNVTMFMGSPQYSYGPTLFSMLLSLKTMKDKGKSDKKIQKEINRYYQNYCCASERENTLSNLVHVIRPAYWKPYYKGPVTKPSGYIFVPAKTEPYTYYAIHNYAESISDIASSFEDFVRGIVNAYNGK
jgi:RHS repeat-associated protein